MADLTDAKDAIAALSRHFETAYRAGDARALVEGYFAPDDLSPAAFPPGTAPVRGRAALIALFDGMFAGAPDIRLEAIEVTAADGLAFEVGRAHLTGAGGEQNVGRYTVCYILSAEGWRAKTDFFTTDGWTD